MSRITVMWFVGLFVFASAGLPGRKALSEEKGSGWALLVNEARARGRGSEEEAPVSECVKYSEKALNQGMSLRLENTCRKPVDCKVSWIVRCERSKADKIVVTRTRRDRRLFLARGKRSSINASTSMCGAGSGWRIEDIDWYCSPR